MSLALVAGPYNVDKLPRLEPSILEWRNFRQRIYQHGTINDGCMNLIDYIGDEGISVVIRPVGH